MATPSMLPQWSYMHIAGQDASEYLSPGLVQFAQATESYFNIGNKFRNPTVAPTHDVTTERSQRLQLRFVPVDREDTQYSYKTRFQLAVGDNRVLDMASTYFDIRGTLDRGASFKPYSGTAYNSFAPKSAPNNTQFRQANNGHPAQTIAQASYVATIGGANNDLQMGVDERQLPVYANTTYQPEPQLGIEGWTAGSMAVIDQAGGRVLRNPTQTPCYGSYAKPTNEHGGITKANTQVEKKYYRTGDNGNPETVFYTEEADVLTPDTHLVHAVPAADRAKVEGLSQHAAPNRPNFIGFRDCFVGLMYYNSGGNLGVLAGQSSQLNAVVDLQDRNTELSYQMLLANTTDRSRYFSMWNQAMDSYDPEVRVIDNVGVEDEMPNYCFPLSGVQIGNRSHEVQRNQQQWQNVANSDNNYIGKGNLPAMEINLAANLWRSFLYSNVALYLPDNLKFTPHNIQLPPNTNTYEYMNGRIPVSGLIDTYVNIGTRWSPDVMDNVNPFNHHRNSGLRYRSQLLGNGRFCDFHIQVPQKFFAIRNLLLLPGTYTYEWSFRKDVNMILQSTLGNDLRVDGATVNITSVNLYASFFPMSHNTASTLEAMLRNDTNDQSFNDYLSAANMLYPIPPNATQLPIPSRNWAAFRGWSLTRLKQRETPALGSPFDPYFTYSGTIPYLDGTFYLSHTFRKVAIQFDSSVTWPGNDRLLTPNEFEIKISVDGEGYNVAQSNMTKDWFLVQMLANYNIGYQGYHLPPDYKDRTFSFLHNFIPMCRQVPNPATEGYFGLGIVNHRTTPAYWFRFCRAPREGHPYPQLALPPHWDPRHALRDPERKFLCDRTLWRIPFSSNFMSMGSLTDLGQNLLYANAAHALDMTFEMDPINEPTLLYVLFEVFDVARVHQPHRGVIEVVYLRTPFSAGNATT
uniref:Hexon protein n=1 Tax=Bovine adenovirus B serotype 3 TaxID=10510 RepID=CAPSH_ADEB3|nr:RecName: Full=Hexon protein; Short=CP-H; AltName: Full=Protein II [Bovine adenovirus 3]3ZIF_A Chain A, Hexon Protein [Bovine adenovirus 3]3ZIF_B Chain B, Hexon Protein [Bovine adenovirus 3]3ZIF_C Chain C, Hexon Protein [Bovine adenovirus 3]3ZIF_D Chain D, Hexon Protein [Bovine adenovirus 3]3ZIF_E Chain E, Hexon Protein [Bovine adenovirus 3]3ZIF_F Chain F, Hexon Protein [Bovine adenovirus 3]3ZIF_G Chain G, Hexon Protein [Bovine adenovirus 3]3ZIF_H Chain H, Hexon Protein [Bovine adenovirus